MKEGSNKVALNIEISSNEYAEDGTSEGDAKFSETGSSSTVVLGFLISKSEDKEESS